MTEREFAALAAGGSTLAERLAGLVVPDPSPGDEARVASRLDAWCRAAADGDQQAFSRRLRWDGLSVPQVRQVLGAVQWPPDAPLPGWVDVVREVVAASSGPEDAPDPVIRSTHPLPFEQVAVPFVRLARTRLERARGTTHSLLAPAAHRDLERHLLETLVHLAAPALHLEFTVRRAAGASGLAQLLARTDDPGRRAEYDAFVDDTRRDLLPFCLAYPALARLLACAVDQWVDATGEFLERFSRDRGDVERLFADGRPLGPVVGIEPGLSDRHHNGRSVMALHFGSGTEVMYKPKDLGTELAFNELLRWVGLRGSPLAFRVTKVLARPGYGWAERVPHLPCTDAEGAARFYRRSGMLLALVHVLAGTDCHRGNLIAAGEYPVLLDAECLMHHRPRVVGAPEGAAALAQGELEESVLGTGLLPRWEVEQLPGGGQRATDISALHTADPAELVRRAGRWCFVGTDHLSYELVDVQLPLPTSQPRLDGVPLRLEDHAGEVLDGFAEGYRFLAAHRAGLLAADGPVRALGRQTVRYVHRNTSTYGWLHDRLRDPAYLRDGIDRSIQLDRLTRTASASTSACTRPGAWPLVAAERDQMERLDVPIFLAEPSGDTVRLPGGGTVEGCLREPSLLVVTERLERLGEPDLARQLGLAAGALYGHSARESATVPGRHRPSPPATPPADGRHAEPVSLEEAAARAAARIADVAITAPDGSVTWIAPQYLPRIDRYQLQPVSWDLNTGVCGMALFLAAVESVSGGAGYRDLALGSLQPLRQALRDDGPAVARMLGSGGATGIGSVVYALTRISRWFDELDLLRDACVAAGALDDELVAEEPVDVFVGAAGAVLGLLALHDACRDPVVLERAIACGDRVLRARTSGPSGYRAWATVEGRLLTGFSHGAAGIAYALARLHDATREPAYLAAAEEAIAYEDSVFDPVAANWPDLRGPEPGFRADWCHGAPGIGLARLGGLDVLDTPLIRADIDGAVQAVLRTEVSGPDYLCCGNLGRAEVLLSGATRLGRADLLTAAVERVREVVRRAGRGGQYSLHDILPAGVSRPVFFQGLAGVGYEVLRFTRPSALPSVLLWE